MKNRALNFMSYLPWLAFPALAFFLHRDATSLSLFVENKTLLLTLYSVFIAGPLWVAYGRLNNLDSSDGLKPSQALAVSNFALAAKGFLIKYFSLSIALIFIAVLVVVANGSFPALENWPKVIAISGILSFFVYAVIRVVDILLQTERTLRSVNAWKAEQKERNKQVADLRKARAEKKLVPDENLLRYRQFIVTDEVEVADRTSEVAAGKTGSGKTGSGSHTVV